MKSFRCAFGPVTQTDYVWPPPPADLEGCDVVPSGEARSAGEAGVESGEPRIQAAVVEERNEGEELLWPPPQADLDECRVVRLDEEAEADGDPVPIESLRLHLPEDALVEEVSPPVSPPAIELPPPLPFHIDSDVPTQPITPLSVATGRPLFPLVPEQYANLYDEPEEEEDPHPFLIPPTPEPPAEPERPRGSGFAWAAVFAAISCAAVAYSEFQAGRRDAIAESVPSPDLPPAPARPNGGIAAEPARAVAPPIASEPADEPAVTPAPPAAVESAPPPARPRAAEPKRRPEPEPEPRVVLRAARVTPSRPTPPPSSVRPPAPAPTPAPTATNAVATVPPPAREGAQVTAPATIARATPPASPAAEPMVHTAALDTSASETAAADEQHIESTLTRFRVAYSKLDARAAREVWPSVDVEALDRAFRGLKSQELRFDQCELTVDGARARAACRGRAVYVPRVGNQSPKAAQREWTFELRKSDQRWTIASARSS
jgi:hypothetical protein